MGTVADVAPRSTAGPAVNFDPLRAYEWPIIRPGTAAGFNKSSGANDPALFDDFTTENASAGISITDAVTNLTVAGNQLTDAVLNQYLGFDASGWDWGATPVADRGAFAFALEPDSLGNGNRVIDLVYTPTAVPEPGTLALVGGVVVAAGWWRRRSSVSRSA
jgi:hypothetical protein